ncbi:PHD finger protein 12 [Tachysurus ichikawai]
MWDKMETPTIVYDLDTSGGLMEVSRDAQLQTARFGVLTGCRRLFATNPNLARAAEVGRRRETEPEVGEEQQESRTRDQPRHLRQLPRRRRPAVL